MSTENKKVSWQPHPLVEKLVADPASPPEVTQIDGYLGRSSRADHVRVYHSLSLDQYTDIPESALLHVEDLSKEQIEFGGSRLWVNARAEVVRENRQPVRTEARFLEGSIADSYLEGTADSAWGSGYGEYGGGYGGGYGEGYGEDIPIPPTLGGGCMPPVTMVPSCRPMGCPTMMPTCVRTCLATCAPTCAPTCKPTCKPTCPVSCVPTCRPTCLRTCAPTCAPTCRPTCKPTCPVTCAPTCRPTCARTCAPTCKPTCKPTCPVTCAPTCRPTCRPTMCATCIVTCMPTCRPTLCPAGCRPTLVRPCPVATGRPGCGEPTPFDPTVVINPGGPVVNPGYGDYGYGESDADYGDYGYGGEYYGYGYGDGSDGQS